MSEVLNLENRRAIYTLVQRNPGLNLSSIAEMLTMSVPLADYHLNYLADHDLIIIVKEEGSKRYYTKDLVITKENKKIMSLLHQETSLGIILFLLQHPRAKPREIREMIDISPALLTYYLKKLVKRGAAIEQASVEKKEFSLVNEEQIALLIIQYKPNVLLKRFRDSWVVEYPLSSKISEEKNRSKIL